MKKLLLFVLPFLASCASPKIVNIGDDEIQKTEIKKEIKKADFEEIVDIFAKKISEGSGIVATRHRIGYFEKTENTCKAKIELEIFLDKNYLEDSTLAQIDIFAKKSYYDAIGDLSLWTDKLEIIEATIQYKVIAVSVEMNNENGKITANNIS